MADPSRPENLDLSGRDVTGDAGRDLSGLGGTGADTGFVIVGGSTDRFECVLDTVPIDRRAPCAIVILRMIGKIDSDTQHGMRSSLRAGLHARPRHLLVDLSGVTFCGVRAFSMLHQFACVAADDEIDYALCGLTPHLDRTATTLWGLTGPMRYRSVPAAVTMIRAAHALGD